MIPFLESGHKRLGIETECKHCRKIFICRPTRIRKYCSNKCRDLSKRNRVELTCAHCNKTFYRVRSALNQSRSGIFFCCRACKEIEQSFKGSIKEIRPKHYNKNGVLEDYRKYALQIYDNKCYLCGYDRYIEVLEVHHMDGNREN